jgi:hypothetical protein
MVLAVNPAKIPGKPRKWTPVKSSRICTGKIRKGSEHF